MSNLPSLVPTGLSSEILEELRSLRLQVADLNRKIDDLPSQRWTLTYHHDGQGNRVAGTLAALRTAIENGRSVRIVMGSGASISSVVADTLWVRDGIVYAQNTSHISVDFPKIQPDAYHWYILVNTTGFRDMSRWSVGAHTDRGHTNDRIEIKWFVS